MRYGSGDVILYNPSGICRITDIREESLGGAAGEYYVLKPVYREDATIYVPVDSEPLTRKMQPLLSPDEAKALLDARAKSDPDWIEDSRERADTYMRRIMQGDRPAMIGIIRRLTAHKEEVARLGHKFYASDDKVLGAAKRMVGEELAFVLNETPQAVIERLLAP